MSKTVEGILDSKRSSGQYYTQGNPFSCCPFRKWARLADLPEQHILEPFAGSNSLIKMLSEMGLCSRYSSFDMSPADENVFLRDSLNDFTTGYEVCVTNPPRLAKNSATVRGLPFPDCDYDDLYKFVDGEYYQDNDQARIQQLKNNERLIAPKSHALTIGDLPSLLDDYVQ